MTNCENYFKEDFLESFESLIKEVTENGKDTQEIGKRDKTVNILITEFASKLEKICLEMEQEKNILFRNKKDIVSDRDLRMGLNLAKEMYALKTSIKNDLISKIINLYQPDLNLNL